MDVLILLIVLLLLFGGGGGLYWGMGVGWGIGPISLMSCRTCDWGMGVGWGIGPIGLIAAALVIAFMVYIYRGSMSSRFLHGLYLSR